MTVGKYGQMITFAVEDSGDPRFSGFRYVNVTKADRRILDIANKYGQRPQAQYIANLNGVRWVDSKLKIGRPIRIPDRLRGSMVLNVYAGDTAPTIVGGYAKVDIVARTERTGLSVFQGYDPITLSIPIRFESDDLSPSRTQKEGQQIEDDIQKLEMMAGRGIAEGSRHGVGPPPIIRISTYDTDPKNPIPLIPINYQWAPEVNPNAPVYWIAGIEWDSDPWRNSAGNRVRQLATVTAMQYVSPQPGDQSISVREKIRSSKKGKLIARRESGRIVGQDLVDDLLP